MHIPPALQRWSVRLVLAIVVATLIGYVPGHVLRRDPRAGKLREQIDALDVEARALAAGNASLRRDIRGLATDVGAIEDRARADLGMVYPDEVVFRVAPPAEASPGEGTAP
ncbi:MAG TPA: septum formation initiator family protein [Kofleriaceae bacterium]|nr:septum formation initiator family protein [Kofleriaceae bacterium]